MFMYLDVSFGSNFVQYKSALNTYTTSAFWNKDRSSYMWDDRPM